MDQNKQNTSVNSVSDGGMFPAPSSFDVVPQPTSLDAPPVTTGSLLSNEYTNDYTEALPTQEQPEGNKVVRFLKRGDVLVACVLLISIFGVITFASLRSKDKTTVNPASVAVTYGTQQIPLSGFLSATDAATNLTASNVVLNGTLMANSGIVVTPSTQPKASLPGQLYFDQNTNQLAYYNGTQYVPLAAEEQSVQSIAGISGALTLGGGLSVVGNQLSVVFPQNEGVTFPGHVSSFAGLTGAITAGRGLAMNGSDLQNSGVLSIAAGTPNLQVANDGQGNITISSVGGGTGTVTSAGGTPGRIAKFTGVQNVEDSLLGESGTTVTVNGNLSITGTLTLPAPLNVTTGGTGAATLATNGVIVGQGTSALTSVTAAGAGLCLISSAGAPSFQTCPSAGGVTSLNSLTGALTLSDATTAGNTITLNDATTTSKGIASFNSTNLSVTAGTVNTIQNINTAATPTFSGVNTNTITPSGAFTAGTTAQNFTLQGASGSTITATNGGNTTTLSFQPATASVVYRLPTTAAGSYDICTTAGNCVGVGGSVTTPGGSVNALAKFTGTQTLADSIISDNGTLATITGNTSVTGSLTLGTALGVGNGGTGAATLTANGVVIGHGTSALTAVTSGTPGECLISTAGAPVFQTCPGSGGVTSLNGLTGAITLANASAAGSTITLNDATTAAKGIASFNSTNFSVTSGAVNTIQNINTGAAPTFGQLSLTSSQATNPMLLINNTNVGATGALLDLQVNGSSKFSVQPNGNTAVSGTVNGQTISSSANFTGSMAVAGNTTLTGDIAVNGGDITSTGALNITPGGTLTVGSGTQTLALQGGAGSNFVVTSGANTTTVNFQAPTANVTYRIPTATAGAYDFCTTAGNCVGTGGGVSTAGGSTNRLAKFSGAQAIGDSTITDNGTTVTTTANMVVQGGSLTSGVANSQTGSLVLGYGAANFSGTVTQGAITASRTYTLPDASGTFCLNGSSACGFVTGSGAAFVQGGNTFGAAADLGTNDAMAVNIRTGGTTRLSISSAGNASFTGDVAVNGGDVTSSGALNITPSGALTAGSSTQTLALQGGASSSLAITNGANTTTVNFQAPTANVSYRFAAAAAGNYDVCTTTGNCVGAGGGVTTSGGSTNRLAKFSGAQAIGDSTITDNGATVTTTANFVIQGGTGTIGVAGSQNGTLVLAYGGGAFTGSISTGGLTANRTYTLPDDSGTFCLTSGNCLGPIGSGANVSLSNLNAVAINTSLLPGTATIDLGSSSAPFRNLYIAGSSSTPGSNNFAITGTATAARTITLPDASGTVCLNGAAACGFATGSGTAFVQGGNNFGAAANLGTGDAFDLNLRRGGATQLTVGNGTVTLASNVDLLMQGATAYISNSQGSAEGEAFGMSAATSPRSVGVGSNANAAGNDAVAIGRNTVTNNEGIAIGSSANANNTGAVAIGYQSLAEYIAVAIGANASAYNGGVAIGAGSSVTSMNSIAIGTGAVSNASNQIVIGADGYEIDHLYMGSGVADATPTGFTIQATGGSGTNVAGASANIASGAGTGSANGGNVNLQIAAPGVSGSAANVPATVLSLSGNNGSALFKNAANSATALQVQTSGGTPVFTVNTSTLGVSVGGTSSATGNINSSGGALQTAGTTRVDNSGNLTNIGNITGTGAMAISSSGTMTIGNTSQILALQGNASTTLSATGGGFTTTVGFTGTATGAVTYNFDRTATAGTYAICTSVGNCSGTAATLQSVYNNSSNPEIVLDATRGALTLRDNSTPLGGNLFEVQNNAGSTTYFGVTASGVNVAGAATVSGNINTSSGGVQTGGTTRVDNSGNLTNISNITGTGAITIASTGAGNDIIVDGADIFSVMDLAEFNGAVLFNNDVDYSFDNSQNVAIDGTYIGSTAINMVDSTLTNNTTSGTQNVMQLQNKAGTGTTEALFVADNADTDTAVTDGLLVTSATGTIVDGLDVSDSDIVNALNFGSNTLLGTTGDIDMTYFDITGSTGSFTSAGTATIQGGTVTIGTSSQTGSLVLYDGSSNTGTIQTTALSTNQTYTLPAAGGTFCMQNSASCGFATGTTASYIQNQNAAQQSSSSFWVSGASRIDGTLTVPTLSSASGNLTLQSATNALTLNGIDTVSANGSVSYLSGGNNSITLNSGGTGSVNVGTNANNKTINIGVTGATANTTTINIGTSTGAAQTINLGSSAATTSLYGTVQIGSLGAVTANTRTVCRDDTTGALVVCDASNTSTLPFLQNGNSFGATATIGTNDANSLQVKTNNTIRATFDQAYNLYLGNGITATTPSGARIAATGSSSTSAVGSNLTLQGGAGATTTTGSAGGDIVVTGGNAGGTGNNAGGSVLLQGGTATGTGLAGGVTIKNLTNNANAFRVLNGSNNAVLKVSTTSDTIDTAGQFNLVGNLNISGSTIGSYVTPAGTTLNAKISVANIDPSGFGQIMALGLPTSANTTARVLALYDGRTVPHQPTLAVLSPDENNIIGLNWNGVSTTGYLMTTDSSNASNTSAIAVRSGETSSGGNSGTLTLQSGNIAGGSGNNSGAVSLVSGNGGGTNASSGSITIDSGSKTGTGTNGAINIGTTNSRAITIGSTTGATSVDILSGTGGVDITGSLTIDSLSGAGLTDCDAINSKLLWDATTSTFSCGSDKPNVVARKTTQQSTTGTTFINDNAFTFAIAANEVWAFQIMTTYSGSTSNSVPAIRMAGPSGATCNIQYNNLYQATNYSSPLCSDAVTIVHTNTDDDQYFIWGTIAAGATPGSATLQFARDSTSPATTITAKTGGYMVAYKLTGVDLAEAYQTKDATIAPGNVVSVDGSLPAGVKKTSGAYDNMAMGIVSTNPGYVLGDPDLTPGGSPVLLALSGRVPVKVSLENGPIAPGDYLTTSSTPGVAMKATRPGQMIGKALEAFDSNNPNAQGMVMTFTNLTWADPNSNTVANNTLQGTTAISGDLNVSGTLTTVDLKVTGTATINNLVVGTMTAQNITVSGAIKLAGDLQLQGVGQSRNAITKRFVASKPVAIGDVVIIDAAHDGQVTTTITANDTRVVGVALTAAQQAGETIDVAIGGSVQVHTANGSQIQGGDMLVSATQDGRSDTSATPLPGSVIGKALGKPDADGGMAWVLITLQ